ncbi:MAG: IS701 family transposase [Myxococcota bacterium]
MERLSSELEEFLEYCFHKMGRSERREALGNYVRGVLLDGERKAVLPMARRLCRHPSDIQGMRQRLQQAAVVAKWDERELFRRLAVCVDAELPGVDAFVVDDTGFPKKGRHSVGVQRQYSGTLGRVDNCQVATSLHLASEQGGACIGMRLALPKSWAEDRKRCDKAGVPSDVGHRTKSELVLEMLDDALGWGLAPKPVVADSGYGDSNGFRQALQSRGLGYVVGVTDTAKVWPPETQFAPPPPKPPGKKGRQPTRPIPVGEVSPVSIGELARSLPSSKFRRIRWKPGDSQHKGRRFAFLRVRLAHRHGIGRPPGDELWLLCEWSFKKQRPTAFYLSNLPPTTTRRRLVYLAKLRWRIERDYQEMKTELGLDHFEGRTWRGFHHHVALVAAAHAFLTLQRALFPPQQSAATELPRLPPPPPGRPLEDARALSTLRL